MCGLIGGRVLGALVAEAGRVDTSEQVLAPAEEHRGNHEVNLVDEPCGEVFANGRDAAAKADVFPVSRLPRLL